MNFILLLRTCRAQHRPPLPLCCESPGPPQHCCLISGASFLAGFTESSQRSWSPAHSEELEQVGLVSSRALPTPSQMPCVWLDCPFPFIFTTVTVFSPYLLRGPLNFYCSPYWQYVIWFSQQHLWGSHNVNHLTLKGNKRHSGLGRLPKILQLHD